MVQNITKIYVPTFPSLLAFYPVGVLRHFSERDPQSLLLTDTGLFSRSLVVKQCFTVLRRLPRLPIRPSIVFLLLFGNGVRHANDIVGGPPSTNLKQSEPKSPPLMQMSSIVVGHFHILIFLFHSYRAKETTVKKRKKRNLVQRHHVFYGSDLKSLSLIISLSREKIYRHTSISSQTHSVMVMMGPVLQR